MFSIFNCVSVNTSLNCVGAVHLFRNKASKNGGVDSVVAKRFDFMGSFIMHSVPIWFASAISASSLVEEK